MALSTADFWKLCIDSRLLSPAECHERDAAYRRIATQQKNGIANDITKLAKWLISEKVLTVYQAKILLGGRPGPFIYGEYQVHELVTSGRQAGLFRAIHLPTGHRVALWPLTGPAANDPARIILVRQKVEIARRAAHPLLCACYELVESAAGKFIVLEDLSGQSLEEHLSTRGSLPLADACRIAQLSALALSCLHEHGQAHGEIRPANVWLGPSGEIKVLQVPLSRDPLAPPGLTNNPAASSESDTLTNLADYMAPELIQGGRAPHPPADVYALGCTLYQTLAGRPPFAGGDWRQKTARHAMAPVEPLARVGVPAPLSKFVSEMLAKDPALRPPVLQVAKALVRHAAGAEASQAVEPPTLNSYERMLIQRRAPLPAPPAPPKAPQRPQPAPSPDEYPIPLSARTTPEETRRKKARARATQQYLLLGGTIFIFFTSLIVAMLALTGRLSPPQIVAAPRAKAILRPAPPSAVDPVPKEPNTPEATDNRPVPVVAAAPRRVLIAQRPSVLLTGVTEQEDDGQSLWASPTKGTPIRLRYTGAGAQGFLAIRPAEVLEHPQGEKVLAAIGPAATQARQQLETIAGVSCSNIEQLIVVLYDAGDAQPEVSFVVRLRKPIPVTELRHEWKDATATAHQGQSYYVGHTWAYYLPHGTDERVLAIAGPDRMKEIIDADGAKPLMSPRLEWLLDYTDEERTLTVAFLPSEVFVDHGVWTNVPAALRKYCESVLGETTAALVSLHLDRALFAELRFRSRDEDVDAISNSVRNRLAALADDASANALAAANADPSASQLVHFLPQMAQTLIDYCRSGAEDDQVVVRWYLPATAASHIVAATELALVQRSPMGMAPGPKLGGPRSVPEALAKKVDLSFPRDTLESAIQLLSREIGVPIEILGSDLQLEGITKNHSFGLDEHQQSAGEILRKILWQANPDGKLVYVIKAKAVGGPPMLFITTRSAAKKRGDTIPAELEQNAK